MNNENHTHYLKREGYSQSTITYYQKVVNKFTQWAEQENIAPTEVTYTEILAYVQHCQQQGAGKTGTSRYLTAIKNYYNYLVSTGEMKGNPAGSIKLQGLNKKKCYDILSASELSILYQHYSKQATTWKHTRNVAIAGLVIFQGLTATDMQQLTPQRPPATGRKNPGARQ